MAIEQSAPALKVLNNCLGCPSRAVVKQKLNPRSDTNADKIVRIRETSRSDTATGMVEELVLVWDHYQRYVFTLSSAMLIPSA